MNQPNAITILAADLVSTRACQLLDALMTGSYEPIRDCTAQLREALGTYAECRIGAAVAEPDPQRMNCNDWAPAPTTQRSAPRG